jgi:hypothetical protein
MQLENSDSLCKRTHITPKYHVPFFQRTKSKLCNENIPILYQVMMLHSKISKN